MAINTFKICEEGIQHVGYYSGGKNVNKFKKRKQRKVTKAKKKKPLKNRKIGQSQQ